MDVKSFRIIEGLVVTPKSKQLFEKEKKITLFVDVKANKSEVKRAVEDVWGVKVKKVWTLVDKGCFKRFSGRVFKTRTRKKAVVSLKDGYNIDLPWQQADLNQAPTVDNPAANVSDGSRE